MDYEENLMIKIAWLYYKEGFTQQQISDELGITRMRVIKLLDVARLTNIVQFHVNLDAQNHLDLQKALEARFHLDEVYIAPSSSGDPTNTVAMAAAQFISHKLENASRFVLNVGAGATITRALHLLNVPADKDISIISLTGGVSYYIHPQGRFNIVHPMPERIKSYIIPSPMVANSAEAAHMFLSEPSVIKIMNMSQLADMTILGIGSITRNATLIKEGILSDADFALLRMRNAVGDMLSQYYDINGQKVDFAVHDRLVVTDLQALRSLKNVVGVAGGKEKVSSILGALNGGYLNVLITDENTARLVLDYEAN